MSSPFGLAYERPEATLPIPGFENIPEPVSTPVTGANLSLFSGLALPRNSSYGLQTPWIGNSSYPYPAFQPNYSSNIGGISSTVPGANLLGIGSPMGDSFGLRLNPTSNYRLGGSNIPESFWDQKTRDAWINNMGKQTMWQGIGTLGGLALNTLGAFNALQGLKLSKKAFNFNKGLVLNNMENNVRSFNNNLYNYYQAKATAETGNRNAYADRARAGYLQHIDGNTPGVPA